VPGHVLLHIGTHKTGSTAIQRFLANNRTLLPAAGVYVPLSAVQPEIPAGHHALPIILGSDAPAPALANLERELRSVSSPLVVISAEDLSTFGARPDRLAMLAQTFERAGFATKILVYVRAQGPWIESMYGEIVRQPQPAPAFGEFLDTTLALGGYPDTNGALLVPFAYTELLKPFAAQFGAGNVIARAYPGGGDSMDIFRDFRAVLEHLHPPFARAPSTIRVRQHVWNESLTFEGLVRTAHAHIVPSDTRDPIEAMLTAERLPEDLLTSRFRLMSRQEMLAVLERFRDDNARLAAEYSVSLPFLDPGDVPPAGDPRWERARVSRTIYDRSIATWREQAASLIGHTV
jgi:hypothetical protein